MSIAVKELTKIFGEQKAVNNISFEIGKGIIGFLGPNGAGKSTTMKMLSTYVTPTSGMATVCGINVVENPMEVRRKIGYLPESNPLYFDMYVREYLEFAADVHQLGKNKKARVDEMIHMTGLSKEVKKKIGNLSKGYKQRVGLAQAMIHNPEVLILDEPTSGLDPNQIVEIRDLITGLGKEKTVLLSTHIMQEVQAMCSRLIIINNGRIVADDSLDKIQNDQQNAPGIIVTFGTSVDSQELAKFKHILKINHLEDNKWELSTQNRELLRKELLTWSLATDTAILGMQDSNQSLEDAFRDLTKN